MYNYCFRNNMMNLGIVSFAKGEVNGDGIQDNIYLTGKRSTDSAFTENITLIIQDGRTGRFFMVPLRENSGYDPSLFIGDFTGDGSSDILISIATGGSGGIMYHYIYSFVNNTAKLIFDFNAYNEKFKYDVTYKDFYKVQLLSKENNESYIIDISQKDPRYLNEIYDEKGKLKSPISGFVNPLSGLYPVDFDYNGVYELLAYEKIAGRYNADSLGYVLNTLKWKNEMFVLDNQNVAVWGTQV